MKLAVALLPHELESRTWIQMVRTVARMERRLEAVLAVSGLSGAQFDVLANLRAEEGITQQELAARLLVTKGNVCGLIDRMEAAGWVERRSDVNDRRANRLYLTRRGTHLLARVAPDQHRAMRQIMSALNDAEVQSLFQLLDRLEASAADHDGPTTPASRTGDDA